jgi:hypothetical protein
VVLKKIIKCHINCSTEGRTKLKPDILSAGRCAVVQKEATMVMVIILWGQKLLLAFPFSHNFNLFLLRINT